MFENWHYLGKINRKFIYQSYFKLNKYWLSSITLIHLPGFCREEIILMKKKMINQKTSFKTEKELQEAISQEKTKGTSDLEIGQKYL